MGHRVSHVAGPPTNDRNDPQLTSSEQANLDLYYDLSRALLTGSSKPRRPPLPLELVRYIVRLSCLTVPAPHLTLYADADVSVTSNGSLTRKVMAATPPLTRAALARLARVRVRTLSQHQGWVNFPGEGSWSWFELAVLRGLDSAVLQNEDAIEDDDDDEDATSGPTSDTDYSSGDGGEDSDDWSIRVFDDAEAEAALAHIPTGADGQPLTFLSHKHPVDSSGETESHEGAHFGPEHELWRVLRGGDALAVVACAKYPGWACIGEGVELEFEEFFEPGVVLDAEPSVDPW